MRRAIVLAAVACLAVPAAALAARAAAYQGYTSQGGQIKFKRAKAGISRMSIVVRASCFNSNGQNQGDYEFTVKAADTAADPLKSGRFTTKLDGAGKVPDVVIKGALNHHGTFRGTLRASGPGKGPDGEDLGTCKSATVRWTAGA